MLIEPALALALLGVTIPWSSRISLPVPAVGTADLLVGVVVVLWLARGVVRREIRLCLPPVTLALMLFLWMSALSLTQAFSWGDGVPEWLKWAEFLVLYVVASQLLSPR
jgi:hypothetical protein